MEYEESVTADNALRTQTVIGRIQIAPDHFFLTNKNSSLC